MHHAVNKIIVQNMLSTDGLMQTFACQGNEFHGREMSFLVQSRLMSNLLPFLIHRRRDV